MQKNTKRVNIGIFNGLSEEAVNSFAKDLERLHVSQGEAIISEHSWGDNIFFICKGKVEINKSLNNPETPFAQLSVLEPGEFFGEMGIINDEPRSASVIALEDAELLIIPREVFSNITFTHPLVMFNLMRTLSGRLRETNERFVDVMNQMLSKNRLMAIGLAASKIIHDIKTPLTVMVLTAQLIESIYPGSEEFTDSIVKQTKLIDQLVREVLDFAKGTETPPLIQKIDLDVFFKEIQDIYGTALQGRNINFVVDNKIRDYVYFDEGKIRRVLINLIKNASEAIPVDGELRITSAISSGWLQISVIDNGPGISFLIREDLFQPFVSEGKPHGTGLGLAICKKLVQEHHGRLEYIPLEPHGSRFDIRIPQNMK
ncbi:MAG: cyclic nucleotide-binding domain-containing protein [Candidatus Cloacimonetes bacterium]|nr:cyclic nucleotide-binding domain-containing protein [Candidatus Cloacimonadota bacterium]